MRACHEAVADFVPPPGVVWRGGGTWSPGLITVHNDATTHNAAWRQRKLTGFYDWDFAGRGAQSTGHRAPVAVIFGACLRAEISVKIFIRM
jgi:hypothetical protein